jgi:site-specific recombinase XerD
MTTGLAYVEQDLPKLDVPDIVKDRIHEYLIELKSNGLKDSSLVVLYKHTATWFPLIDFQTCNMKEIRAAIVQMDKPRGKKIGKRIEKEKLEANTRRNYVFALRKFLEWLVMNEYLKIQLHDERGKPAIKLPKPNKMTRTAAELLNEDEINKLILAGPTTRDRFLISLMYVGGMRPTEVVHLRWSDVMQDQYGLLVNTAEKTGVPRKIRIPAGDECIEYYVQWKNDYAALGLKPEGQSPLFVKSKGEIVPITYETIRNLIRKVVRRSKLSKPISAYLLRHSKITSMLADGTPETAVKKQFWGTETSMLKTYSHLTSDDADRMILQSAGIIKDDPKKKKERPKCPRCFTINNPAAGFCMKCGEPLSEDARQTKDTTTSGFDALSVANLTDEELGAAVRAAAMRKAQKA